MPDYELKSETFEVPKNTGTEGFLLAIKTILKMPKVQGISIDARGKVTYQQFVERGEFHEVGPTISFETLMPYACVRNGSIKELVSNEKSPAITIAKMFQVVARERLYPVAWVTGANTTLWDWFRKYSGLEMENQEDFYGLPVLTDRHLDDYVLVLATSFGRSTNIVDVQKSFKIIMPQRKEDALDRDGGGEGGDPIPGGAGPVQAVGVRSGAQPGGSNGKAGTGGPGNRGSAPG
jgi:hypothetical protein